MADPTIWLPLSPVAHRISLPHAPTRRKITPKAQESGGCRFSTINFGCLAMIIKREISQTLDSIYDAALDSKCWSEVLAAAAHALNFKAGAFSHQELLPRSLNFLQFYGIETSGIEAYSAHYFSRNVWIPVMLRQPDVPVVPSAHVPFSELKRTEFYADWLRRVGFDDGVSGFVRRSDTSFIMFSLFRDSKSEPVGVEEKHNFAELLPHIRRAVEIHQRMAMTQSARDGAIAALSALN